MSLEDAHALQGLRSQQNVDYRVLSRLCSKSEALEVELSKNSIRSAPLGLDRHQRLYWWNLAGDKSVLLVQTDSSLAQSIKQQPVQGRHDEEAWALLDDVSQVRPQCVPMLFCMADSWLDHRRLRLSIIPLSAPQVEALTQALDERGLREQSLKTCLEKVNVPLTDSCTRGGNLRFGACTCRSRPACWRPWPLRRSRPRTEARKGAR